MSENLSHMDGGGEPQSAVVGVGEMLSATRESHGLSVADAAHALKLTQRQIEALECERFDLLPGAAFARGFLRNYARYLGIDPEPLLQALAQTDGVGAPELAPVCNAEGTMPASDGGLRPSALPIAVLAVLLLSAVVAGWYFDWFEQPRETAESAQVMETPVAPAALTPVPPAAHLAPVVIPDDAPADATALNPAAAPGSGAPAATGAAGMTGSAGMTGAPMAVAPPLVAEATKAAAADAAPADAEPAAPPPQLVFRFTKESWVEVRDAAGEIIFARTNRAGTVQEVQGTPPFKLVVGNARSVTLEYGGKPVDLAPHTKISVARLTLE